MKYPKLTYTETDNWKLIEDFEIDGYIIPKGFITDLASVPSWLWSIMPPFGKWMVAAIIHDYLYQNGIYNRKQCDKELYKYCIYYNTPIYLGLIIYLTVRLFGKKKY